jgi:hypothetical protein
MRISKLLLTILCLLGALSTSALAQHVTTEMIAPLSGNLSITFPNNPCFGQQDTITFSGSVHVSATVDTAQNTVDYHINLLSVKGAGAVVAKYVGNGAIDLLDQNYPGTQPVPSPIKANLFPSGPCRAGFPSTDGLPVVVTITFGTDFTLSSVSAVVGQT